MMFWRAVRFQQQASRVPAMVARSLSLPNGRDAALQWIIISVAGIVLGIYTIGVVSFLPQWALLLVTAALFPFIAMIVGNIRKLLLTIIILDIPFQLDTYLGYRTEFADLGALGGWNVSVTTICLVILYTLWLGEFLTRQGPRSNPWLRASLHMALYPVVAALSVIVAHDITLSLFEIFLLLQMFLLYIYIIASVRTRQDVLFIVTMLLIGLTLESLIIIGLQFAGQTLSIGGIAGRVDGDLSSAGSSQRIGGTVGSPNTAGSYLSFLLAPAVGLLVARLGGWYNWLAIIASSLGGVALLLTFSRGGWIAFVLSIIIFCLLVWHRGWLSLTIPVTMAMGVILLSLFFQDTIAARLFGDDGGAAHGRIPLMRLALKIIEANPVLGVGLNNFTVIMNQYATPEFNGEWLFVVHNKYLLVWAETGTCGLMAFIWFLIVIIRRGWQGWMFKDRLLSSLALGFTAAIVGHLSHMFVDVFHNRPIAQLLWLSAGLFTAMRNLDSDD
jgi:putative inorganic carbon (hco3(-)) transporter